MTTDTGKIGDASISIITPIRNGIRWIDACAESILAQDFNGRLEWSVFDDGSGDGSRAAVEGWRERLSGRSIRLRLSRSGEKEARGVAAAKNAAWRQSSGEFLCFLDVDDRMRADRLRLQWEAAVASPDLTLVGSRFVRDPPESSARYTRWANELSQAQLRTQAYTSHGPTLIAPTWFCRRSLLARLEGFKETLSAGFPEDLELFYRLLRLPGSALCRVEAELVTYTYHAHCASLAVTEAAIARLRNAELERGVLIEWPSFSIWNAGKVGKALLRALSPTAAAKVCAFVDVDERKLRHGRVELFDPETRSVRLSVPIVAPEAAVPPCLIAVKLDMTEGQLEARIASLGWVEGCDFIHLN